MTNDEILQAAKDADPFGEDGRLYLIAQLTPMTLERFAAIIEKRTIERCAVSAEPNPDDGTLVYVIKQHIAAAIRKLGEQ